MSANILLASLALTKKNLSIIFKSCLIILYKQSYWNV